MYNLMNSSNVVLTFIYFFFVIIFGCWFILNLILAVFMDSFTDVDTIISKEKKDFDRD